MSIDTHAHRCQLVEHLRRDAERLAAELADAEYWCDVHRAKYLANELEKVEEEFQDAETEAVAAANPP